MNLRHQSQIKNILIISYDFQPSAQVGAKRFTFLSSILQQRYPELHILTIKEKYISQKDGFLNSRGVIHRSGMFPHYPFSANKLFKKALNRLWVDYLCLMDPFSGWILPAYFKGLKIIKNNNIDLIIATGPTYSSMVIGLFLSNMTKTKLILDYRDSWTNNKNTAVKYCKIFGKKINEIAEILSVKQASALVFCSEIMKHEFDNCLGKYSKAGRHVVPNGYYDRSKVEPLSLGKAKKNMVYAGTFYGERRITLLTGALIQLLRENIITKEDFCLHVFGKILEADNDVIKKFGLGDLIKEHPRVPYHQIIRYLKAADILFLPSGSDVRYAIPFKFFDYLSVKRPIFAVVPQDSSLAQLMNKIDCGRFAVIDNQDSIIDNLRLMLVEKKEYTYSGSEEYSWEKIADKYLKIIDEVNTNFVKSRL